MIYHDNLNNATERFMSGNAFTYTNMNSGKNTKNDHLVDDCRMIKNFPKLYAAFVASIMTAVKKICLLRHIDDAIPVRDVSIKKLDWKKNFFSILWINVCVDLVRMERCVRFTS